jgi:hydroxymethylpyrimidine/phosphomethylpyrimidine kinase
MTCVALTIAGSDPSGGAGMQADLKTFQRLGVYGMSVITLLTVQNTQCVSDVRMLDPELVLAQLDAVLDDIPPQAAKTGALGNQAIIQAVAERAPQFRFPLVVDPVMISKHGMSLIDEDAVQALVESLLPCAYLVTPNRLEAARLADMPVDDLAIEDLAAMERAAAVIAERGAANVLIKGGRVAEQTIDVLWTAGNVHHLAAPYIETPHTHGTGCVLSAAITAQLAQGLDLLTAVRRAKQFISSAIQSSPGLGHGRGPVNFLGP